MLSLCAAALCLTLALTSTALAADFEPAAPKTILPVSPARTSGRTASTTP